MTKPASSASSIDEADVARFSAIAAEWWDPHGKFAPLHALNPTRLGFVRERALAHFGRDGRERAPFSGLRLIDIGCGGGLLCEPLARLGFSVTGIDASGTNISVAQVHAEQQGLEIDYRAGAVEDLIRNGEGLADLVINMEVVEHVVDPASFLRDSARLIAPGGMMVLATLNRTIRSLLSAKIAAEHLLRWLPAGTHDWRKFIRPEEVRKHLSGESVSIEGPTGMSFDPMGGRWSISEDASINYLMVILASHRDPPESQGLQLGHTHRESGTIDPILSTLS